LILSSIYLVWSVGIQSHVSGLARESLHNQNIRVNELITGPAPFNTLLWRTVAMTDSGYAEGFYSLLDKKDIIHFNQYRSENELLESLQDEWAVKRLEWFSKGFYKVSRFEDDIILSDLRMGVEPLYFFSFAVGRVDTNGITAQAPRQVEPPSIDMGANMSRLWHRIWNEDTVVMFE
jgi:inner membrane protein